MQQPPWHQQPEAANDWGNRQLTAAIP